jgi:ADP-heptose:LPS heptosyltransferase
MKFLILRFSSIGDIVLTTPVIRCLRKKYPDAEIHYATKKAFHSIVKYNPYINKVHLLEDSTSELVSRLKEEKFDYVIDLHNNQRTMLIKAQLGIKSSSFNKLNLQKWLMVNFKVNHLPAAHIVDRYLETVQSFGVENDGGGLDYFLLPEEGVNLNSFPDEFHQGYIAWVIGAKQNTKKFPAEKIARVLNQLNHPVILLGGKEDEAEAQTITSKLQGIKASVYNACGKYTLNGSASLVRQAKLVVTNDTGLMHIAAAFKRPTISIWGNTIPQFGMYPYYGEHAVINQQVEVNGLKCRPCSKLGYAQCPQGHFKCMNDIDEELLAKMIHSTYGEL